MSDVSRRMGRNKSLGTWSFTELELYSQGTNRGTRLVNNCVFVLGTTK